MRATEDLIGLADEVELELGPLLGQAAPVAVKYVAVLVVLTQRVVRPLTCPLGQVWPLRDRYDVHL